MCAPHVVPNGTQLSCGADNFQVAENETSSCSMILIKNRNLYTPCVTFPRPFRQLELLVRQHLGYRLASAASLFP